MIIHLCGQLCKLDAIITICKEEGICLPNVIAMEMDDVDSVCKVIKKAYL